MTTEEKIELILLERTGGTADVVALGFPRKLVYEIYRRLCADGFEEHKIVPREYPNEPDRIPIEYQINLSAKYQARLEELRAKKQAESR